MQVDRVKEERGQNIWEKIPEERKQNIKTNKINRRGEIKSMNIFQKFLWKFKKYRARKWTELLKEYKTIEDSLKQCIKKEA